MAVKSLAGLRRLPQVGWVGGVCAGVAYWAGTPVWMVRMCAAVVGIVGLPLSVGYLLAWLFMPAWSAVPADFERRVGAVETL